MKEEKNYLWKILALMLLVVIALEFMSAQALSSFQRELEKGRIIDVMGSYYLTSQRDDDDEKIELEMHYRKDGALKSSVVVPANPETTTVVNDYLYLDRESHTAFIVKRLENLDIMVVSVENVDNVLADWVYKGQFHEGPVLKMLDGSYQLSNVSQNGALEPFDYRENY